jgi:hypothetical protein
MINNKKEASGMEDFFKFKRMIAPVVVRILFWVGVVGCVIGGFALMVAGIGGKSHSGGGLQVFIGLLYIFLGPVFVRLYCEFIIVIFSINDTLTDIRNSLKKSDD